MPLEIEAKVKVESHEPVQARLRALGGVFFSRVRETNRILDDPSQSLRRRGAGLRVRDIEVLAGSSGGPSITYKGPIQPGAMKIRPELDVAVTDAGVASAILEALGYRPFLTFEKDRESWEWGGCRIELDEIPLLGKFVEIEGPDEASIHNVRCQIGLESHPLIKDSYAKLLISMCHACGIRSDVIRF